MPKKTTELTPKEQRFVEEYPVDFNQTKAIIRAGFDAKDENVAHVLGHRLLRKATIKAAIAQRMEVLLKKANTVSEQYIREAARLALCDPRKLLDENGNLLPLHKLPDEIAACIASIEPVSIEITGEDGVKKSIVSYKVRFWNKNTALQTMFEYYQLIQKLGSKGNPIHVKHDILNQDVKKLSLAELIEQRDHPERFISAN